MVGGGGWVIYSKLNIVAEFIILDYIIAQIVSVLGPLHRNLTMSYHHYVDS
jgi:hypothetical protein